MVTFGNPRLAAEFEDWPNGRHKCRCRFWVETGKRGTRVGRETTNRLGAWCTAKYTTYGGPACIVDGSDGKTYVLQVALPCGLVHVRRSDFLDAPHELRDRGLDPAGRAELLALIEAAR